MHCGFETLLEAQRAYILAYALGSVRVRLHRGDPRAGDYAPAAPTPEALMEALEFVDDDFLGAEWHVVYKGKRPGVYPSWQVHDVLHVSHSLTLIQESGRFTDSSSPTVAV